MKKFSVLLVFPVLFLAWSCGDQGQSNLTIESNMAAWITIEKCPPGYNIIEGTDGDDILRGTSDRDCIFGHKGDDEIRGEGGDDILYGGEGNDVLRGGFGNDVIDGGWGDDMIVGWLGDDLLYGSAGNDLINGGGGADSIWGGSGEDTLIGGFGNDAIDGGWDNDLINGGPDNDTIFGGPDNDVVLGGWGANTVLGERGDDACDGESCEFPEPDNTCRRDSDCESGQTCDQQTGICLWCRVDAECDDGNPVNGREKCVPTQGCSVPDTSLRYIRVQPGVDVNLVIGETVQLTAIAEFADGSTLDITEESHWTSSNSGVAEVGNNVGNRGFTSGLTMGTAKISMFYAEYTETVEITVMPAEPVNIVISPNDPTVELGQSIQFKATGEFADGNSYDLTEDVSWSSFNKAIADVDNTPGSKGLVQTFSPGTVGIRAIYGDWGGLTVNLTVEITELVDIEIQPTNVSIPVGDSVDFRAMGTLADGSTLDITRVVTWSSSAPEVAEINPHWGSAEGLSTGTTDIIVQYKVLQRSTILTVREAELERYYFGHRPYSVVVGETAQKTVWGKYTDGTVRDLTEEATWSVSNPMILEVSDTPGSKGVVLGMAMGSVAINANYNGFDASMHFVVTPAERVELGIYPSFASMVVGETTQFTAIATFADGSRHDVTGDAVWKVSDWDSADKDAIVFDDTPGNEGLARGVKVGSTDISYLYSESGLIADVMVVAY